MSLIGVGINLNVSIDNLNGMTIKRGTNKTLIGLPFNRNTNIEKTTDDIKKRLNKFGIQNNDILGVYNFIDN